LGWFFHSINLNGEFMAYSYTTNQTPATCAVAIYNLKTLLKSVGWTIPRSSDGTSYNASADQISSGASGANGMDNAKAWFVITDPANTRQFCFQRQTSVGVNTSYLWRVKYSKGAGFTGGSPAATVTPSATDEQILLGSGTDASPGFAAFFGTTADAGLRHNLVADSANGYGFASFAWVNTSGIPTHGLIFDPMIAPPTADTDPYAIYINGIISSSANGGVAGTGNFQYESILRNNAKFVGYTPAGVWSTSIFGCTLMVSNAGTYKLVGPSGLNANADTKDDAFQIPVIYFNTSTNLGDWKGFSTLMYWSSVIRSTGATLSTTGTKDRVIVCDISLPWDGSTPTV
jgi:hypothetical protein